MEHSTSVPHLTVHDHTLVMQAVLHHVPSLRDVLGPNPSPAEILEAVAGRDRLDPATAERIATVLAVLPVLQEDRMASAGDSGAVARLGARLDAAQTVEEVAGVLGEATTDDAAGDEGFRIGLTLAREALEDGARTIYSPEYVRSALIGEAAADRELNPRPRMLTISDLNNVAGAMSREDAKGIVAGGAGGCAAGALGGTVALPGGGTVTGCVAVGTVGAIAGGVGASAGEAWNQAMKYATGQ
jgi:hypothetical protein